MGKIHNDQKTGILTAGGDCPWINSAIRGVGKYVTGYLISTL